MSDTLPPAPAPPRPDLGDLRAMADRSVGADFYRGSTRRVPRLATVAGISVLVALLSGAALAPALRAWDARHRSHEFTFMATIGDRPIRWNP